MCLKSSNTSIGLLGVYKTPFFNVLRINVMTTSKESFEEQYLNYIKNDLKQPIEKKKILVIGTPSGKSLMHDVYRRLHEDGIAIFSVDTDSRINGFKHNFIVYDDVFNYKFRFNIKRKKMINKTRFKFVD